MPVERIVEELATPRRARRRRSHSVPVSNQYVPVFRQHSGNTTTTDVNGRFEGRRNSVLRLLDVPLIGHAHRRRALICLALESLRPHPLFEEGLVRRPWGSGPSGGPIVEIPCRCVGVAFGESTAFDLFSLFNSYLG